MRHAHNSCCVASLVLLAGSVVAQVGGSNWQTQTTGIAGNILHAVSAVDGNVCWMAGAAGTIVRTTNGGNTWSPINPGIVGTQDIQVFEGVSDNIAFASTTLSDTTHIYRTTNGSSSWARVFAQNGGFVRALKMFNHTKGIAVGDPVGGLWTILKTTNGGETWYRTASEPPQIDSASGGNRFGTLDTTYTWFYDNAGRQYSSPNGGETWTSISEPSSGTVLLCWNRRHNSFDAAALYVTYVQVFRYQQGWVVAGFSPNSPIQPTGLVGAHSTNEYWLVQGRLYYTPNAASTWTYAPPNGLNKPVGLIDMVTLGSEVSAWATGISDTVYHYHKIMTGVDGHPQPIPREFSLGQNYPNPFNPVTHFGFLISDFGFVSLKVYDMLGREVATLINEEKTPGEYEVTWDASTMPSGIYFYRIKAEGVVETRKLIILR